jgi:hypothetical protein
MNKPKLSEKQMLNIKFYRNLRRNLFYGIYFNKFHNICKEKFQKCDHRIGNTFTSAPIFRLRRISIAREKNPTFT